MALMLSRLSGAAPVVAVDTDTTRLALSAELGADLTVDASIDGALAAVGETLGGGARVVVEATGSAEGFERALAATKSRGILVLKSTSAERRGINLAPIVINEIQIVGSRCGPFPPALSAMEADTIDVRSLISQRVPLRDGNEALRRAADPSQLKVLIEP